MQFGEWLGECRKLAVVEADLLDEMRTAEDERRPASGSTRRRVIAELDRERQGLIDAEAANLLRELAEHADEWTGDAQDFCENLTWEQTERTFGDTMRARALRMLAKTCAFSPSLLAGAINHEFSEYAERNRPADPEPFYAQIPFSEENLVDADIRVAWTEWLGRWAGDDALAWDDLWWTESFLPDQTLSAWYREQGKPLHCAAVLEDCWCTMLQSSEDEGAFYLRLDTALDWLRELHAIYLHEGRVVNAIYCRVQIDELLLRDPVSWFSRNWTVVTFR